ncbi:MAG: hypothetical protein JWM34_3629 [Ilumatobacteraceae bacterium]|nr:hypothetical protein [Ilumatobacteraceae bacterium]
MNELTRLVGQPQALVSYHLSRLRAGGLVSSRRSAHDGRASYYRLDLTSCGHALAATGSSLHPGLVLEPATVAPSPSPGRRRRPQARVLFACTGNGTRSQIAETLLRQLAGDRVDVMSGGSHPKPIHPNTVRVLAERGIDIRDRLSKSLGEFDGDRFDIIVTLCDKVREACPEFSSQTQAIHWSIADPSREALPVFRALAADLETRIRFLIATIDQQLEENRP